MANTLNGYLSHDVRQAAENMITHGKIESLPFGGKGTPFRVVLVPKLNMHTQTVPGTYDMPRLPELKVVIDAGPRLGSAIPQFLHNQLSDPKWSDQDIYSIPATTRNNSLFLKWDFYYAAAEYYPN